MDLSHQYNTQQETGEQSLKQWKIRMEICTLKASASNNNQQNQNHTFVCNSLAFFLVECWVVK